MSKILNLKSMLCAGVAVVGLSMSASAMAQTTEPSAIDEITVTSKFDANDEVKTAMVSFSDLDLTTKMGQDELMSRVGKTASDLCHQLGESISDQPLTAMPSCQKSAIASADDQMKMAIAMASSRGGPAPMAMNEPAPMREAAPAATAYSAPASYTTSTVTNGPVPDTKENRAKYGMPMSNAGKHTAAAGN
ncbi:UrcA family protein [Phenylobacterium immobile]|uniref:UrcA family protein n=1 Tax=Phenylobacterium immobile TaxID=21 RepID=UPI000B25A276|nr:UrcA family protein [Phenylobacterium immobile]